MLSYSTSITNPAALKPVGEESVVARFRREGRRKILRTGWQRRETSIISMREETERKRERERDR